MGAGLRPSQDEKRLGTVKRLIFAFPKFLIFNLRLFSGSFDFLIFTLIFEFVLATRARVPTARLTRARVGSKSYTSIGG